MSVPVHIRDALPDERAWADDRYRDIRFKLTAASDLQLIAEIDGQRVGLGRLVRFGPGSVELSGIWTADAARGRGVARLMVTALLERATDEREIWCVPFTHLVDFYAAFGFVDTAKPWPAPVAAKVEACTALGQQVRVALLLRSAA